MKTMYFLFILIVITSFDSFNFVHASCATSDVPCNDLIQNPTAQTQHLTISTNLENYTSSDKIMITAYVPNPDNNTSLEIRVIDPHYVVRDSHIFPPSLNESYSWTIFPRGPLFVNSGNYTVTAKYGGEEYVTHFYLTSESDIVMGNPSSPLQQIKSGIQAQDVKCKQGLQLVIKSEDGSPACVKSDTAQSLVKRGWALPGPKDFGYNPGRGPATLEQQSSQNSTKLNHVIDIISISGTGSLPNPGGPEIQLTLMNIGTKPVTNLNATLVLNNNYTFNFKDVTESNPLASGHSTSDTQILIGAGFRTELAYPIIISGITNNIPFTYTENVHMP